MKSIIFGDSSVSFGDSIYISIISMLIVFFVLIIISSILSLLKYIPSKKTDEIEKKVDKNVKIENRKKLTVEDIKDERMLVAVSAALIDAAEDNPESYIRIVSIKELN